MPGHDDLRPRRRRGLARARTPWRSSGPRSKSTSGPTRPPAVAVTPLQEAIAHGVSTRLIVTASRCPSCPSVPGRPLLATRPDRRPDRGSPMATILINGQEHPIPEGEKLNAIQMAKPGRRRHSVLLLAPRALRRRQLPDVRDRGRDQGPEDGRDQDDSQARPRLPDAGQGRHGARHRQPEGARSISG